MSEDFFGFFEDKKYGHYKHDRSHSDHNYYDDCSYEDDTRHDRHRNSGHGDFNTNILKSYGKKILQNKLLMAGILMFAMVCLIGFIVLVILFFPVISRILDFVFNNGLKVIQEIIPQILNQFLQGSGK